MEHPAASCLETFAFQVYARKSAVTGWWTPKQRRTIAAFVRETGASATKSKGSTINKIGLPATGKLWSYRRGPEIYGSRRKTIQPTTSALEVPSKGSFISTGS
uniref:Uncharacterized protein LOC114348670 n=1 Tax=Diabrotica virgifera virgifera TaxID=50390 RepID=A0A6P7H062_DIAVI